MQGLLDFRADMPRRPGGLIVLPQGLAPSDVVQNFYPVFKDLLLRSRNIRTNDGRTLVPREKLRIHYTLSEGGSWDSTYVWPDVYLQAIRTGRLGPMKFCALRIEGSQWIFDESLRKLYYSPWRFRA